MLLVLGPLAAVSAFARDVTDSTEESNPRQDFLSAGSDFTAEKSVAKDVNGQGALGRSVSQRALAEFFIQPATFQTGVATVCTQVDAAGNCNAANTSGVLKQFTFNLNADGTYTTTDVAGRAPEAEVLGDHQSIRVYCETVEEFPRLATSGIPTLA